MNLEKLIDEISDYDFSYVTQDIENSSLNIDEVKEIELPNYTLSFNLYLVLLYKEFSYGWYQPQEYELVREDIEVTNLKVQGETITEDQQEELQTLIKKEIISTYR